MGVGYWTCEHLTYAATGELLTDRSWNYHVPLARDIPQDWRVYFRKNSYSTDIIFGSKCKCVKRYFFFFLSRHFSIFGYKIRIYSSASAINKLHIFLWYTGIGEPPMCMSVAVALALREAIVAARLESGIPTTKWYQEGNDKTNEGCQNHYQFSKCSTPYSKAWY